MDMSTSTSTRKIVAGYSSAKQRRDSGSEAQGDSWAADSDKSNVCTSYTYDQASDSITATTSSTSL